MHCAWWKIMLEINKLCVNKPRQSMKQEAFAKINSKKSIVQTKALDIAASNINQASIMYSTMNNSIEIGR